MPNNDSKKTRFLAVLKKYFRKDEIWLIPNVLCYVRVFLIILFLCFYLIPMDIAGNPYANVYLGCAMMVIASYTDFLDGFIARKFNQTSELGKIIDPISDKMLQCAVAAALCAKLWQYPMVWTMFGVFVFKEFIMFCELFLMAANGTSFQQAHWYGKLSTFVFYLVLGTLLVGSPFMLDFAAGETADIVINSLCMTAIAVLSFALVMYLILAYRLVRQGPEKLEENDKKEDAEK